MDLCKPCQIFALIRFHAHNTLTLRPPGVEFNSKAVRSLITGNPLR